MVSSTENAMNEKRDSQQIQLKFPIRVSAFGGSNGTFTEETCTIEVNRLGARITLKHSVAPNDTVRIVNLENLREADFRVLAPVRLEGGSLGEWGVECLEPERNLWEIKFSPAVRVRDHSAGALLICGDCGTQSFCALRDWELDILKSGELQRFCAACSGPSTWRYADAASHVTKVRVPEPLADAAAPSAQQQPEPCKVERKFKRLALKMPTLVRDEQGRHEISKTENLSKAGLSIGLGMILEVGDIVSVCCPYSEVGQNFEQKAEVRNRRTFFAGERWVYGMRFLAPAG